MFGWGMAEIPAGFEDLLEQRLYGHLATVGGDGGAQSSPMWFDWDGERVRFTHTKKRAKFRNIQAEPRVASSILDPTNPYRYLEVRGTIDQIDDDPTGSFIQELAHLYQAPWAGTSTGDEADRVILYLRPTKFVSHG
ncbi:PPOX class F420-dependent oxidoreductase [Mycobacteroides abscessus]|uniref:PPOX class F420-dependent oxidoreductase n=1 Tax=Mycobacteroides abscessus TaxID=36809 RepID=UPI0019D306E5|nr:PPOX class F420-dependent oxidoreductase [Mycobacteroides abscessus]MBN7410745.1 PPOX class F420-dependent oxidoreductase [Mycobacteroides abscessus subsp. abscessus]